MAPSTDRERQGRSWKREVLINTAAIILALVVSALLLQPWSW